MSTSDRALSRATDRAIRQENRRAIADVNEDSLLTSITPIYPPGTPEYEAYVNELRAELAKWVNGEAPYTIEED